MMGTMRQLLLCIVLLMSLVPRVLGQEITFKTSVDRNSFAAGEQVRLTLSMSNIQGNVSAPSLGGLTVLRGPSSSTDFTIANGQPIQRTSYVWILTAVSPGKYTIGAATAKVGNATIETDPIVLDVTSPLVRPSSPQLADGQRRNSEIFVTLEISRNKGYVGEQVVLSYMLYSRTPNVEPQYELPKLEGFWAEEIPLTNSGWLDRYETVNGLRYHVAIIKRQLLFPQRSGKITIAPYVVKCTLDRSFFNRGRSVEITSNSIEYTAMELPPGAPADFNGAVGELDMVVKADRTSLKANEAIDLSIRFSGRSNLKLLQAPSIDFPNDFEVYDPKVIDKINVSENGMSGSREFQYLVIPRFEGHHELEPITFTYFDTKSGSYRTLRSQALAFDVAEGEGGPNTATQRSIKTDVKVLGTDIRYIRTGPSALREQGQLLFGSWQWWAGMATPALAFALLLVWRNKRDKQQADVVGTRRKSADRVARERLKAAAQALQRNEPMPFYTALSKALQGYLADKFGLGLTEISFQRLRQSFGESDDAEAMAKEYVALISTCDMARFTPVEERPRKDLYDQAAALIGRTEQLKRS